MMPGRRSTAEAGLHEDLSSLILQFNSVQGLVNSIAQSQSVDAVLSAMVEGIHSELDYDRVGIFTLDEGRECFRLNYVLGVDPLRAEKVRVPIEAVRPMALAAVHRERINILRCLNDRDFSPALYASLGEDTGPSIVLPLAAWHQKPCWQIDHCLMGFTAFIEDPASWREARVGPGDHDRVCLCCPFYPVRAVLWVDNRESGRPVRESLFPLWVFAKQASLSIENLLLHERSRSLSIRDGLTGLYNRRHFLEVLDYEIERGRRLKQALGLAVFDVDRFGDCNRALGFQGGDELLRLLGHLLRQSVRTIDVVGRAGTDSFAVIFPGTEPEDVLRAAERLRRRIAGFPFSLHGRETRLTVSGGVAVFPDDATQARDLFYLAETALQGCTARGGNRSERTDHPSRRSAQRKQP